MIALGRQVVKSYKRLNPNHTFKLYFIPRGTKNRIQIYTGDRDVMGIKRYCTVRLLENKDGDGEYEIEERMSDGRILTYEV